MTPDRTTIPPAALIENASGSWTRAATGAAIRNGVDTAFSVSQLVQVEASVWGKVTGSEQWGSNDGTGWIGQGFGGPPTTVPNPPVVPLPPTTPLPPLTQEQIEKETVLWTARNAVVRDLYINARYDVPEGDNQAQALKAVQDADVMIATIKANP